MGGLGRYGIETKELVMIWDMEGWWDFLFRAGYDLFNAFAS